MRRSGADYKNAVAPVAAAWSVLFQRFTDWRFLGRTPEELEHLISRLPAPADCDELPAAEVPRGWALERRLRPEVLDAIVTDYEAGASTRKLAAERGVAISTIQSLLKRRGVMLRGGRQRVLLTAEQEAEIARRYAAGEGSHTVGAAFGIGTARVLQIARDAGLTIHGTWPDAEVLAEAAKRYRSGLTVEQVAQELGYSRSTMLRAMKEAGIELRPKGRRPISRPSL